MLTGPDGPDAAVDSLVTGMVCCCGRGLWMLPPPEPVRCGCEDIEVVESVVCGACDATGGFAGDMTGRGDICVCGDIWGGRGDI